jgi:hypothetical protein
MKDYTDNQNGLEKHVQILNVWDKSLEKGEANIERVSLSNRFNKAIYTFNKRNAEINKMQFYLSSQNEQLSAYYRVGDKCICNGFNLVKIYIKDENKVLIVLDGPQIYKLLGKCSETGYKMLLFFELNSLATCIYIDTDEQPNVICFSDTPIREENDETISESKKMFDLIEKMLQWRINGEESKTDEIEYDMEDID